MVKFGIISTFATLAGIATAKQLSFPEYYLKTQVISGDSTKDSLYVTPYHTGAGLNIVSLLSSKTDAGKGFLNGTYQQFDLGSNLSWGLVLAYIEDYTQWDQTEINTGNGESGFSFNGKFLVSNSTSWQGWLACDWWHYGPQLFYLEPSSNAKIPSSCAIVELVQEDL